VTLLSATHGPLALLGSGEYTRAMDETDRELLAAIGRPHPRVALIPAASGLEPGSPERWNRMGERHFAALGAVPVAVPFATRDDADTPAVLDALRGADLFYFSGGSPEHLVGCLRDTAAWALILEAFAAGAGIAGCSAGAMMLGAHTLRVRSVAAGQPPRWVEAMGVAAPLVVIPHFDRMSSFVGPEMFRTILASAPPGERLVGIDEDTALVRLAPSAPWQVRGRLSVALIAPDGSAAIHRAGETLGV
jgi:cyanophycinase